MNFKTDIVEGGREKEKGSYSYLIYLILSYLILSYLSYLIR